MKEILGDNLKQFFDVVDKSCDNAEITYAGNDYEIWQVSDSLFEKMCNIEEDEFYRIAGEDAWWRYSDGSNLKTVSNVADFIVNGKLMLGFDSRISEKAGSSYKNLTEYLCECVGASLPKNVCACAVDIAKFNGITMGELFDVYQG